MRILEVDKTLENHIEKCMIKLEHRNFIYQNKLWG